MAQYITARNALMFFSDPEQLKQLIANYTLPFYMKYNNNKFSKELKGFLNSTEKSFYEMLDNVCFEYNTFNAIITKNSKYKALKTIYCDGKECPLLNREGIGEIVTITEARRQLCMSRAMFVDLLNDDSQERLITSYEDSVRSWIKNNGYSGYGNIDYFTVEMLSKEDLFIEKLDWICYKNSYPNLFSKDTSESIVSTANEQHQITDLEAQLAEARASNEKLLERIAGLEAQLAGVANAPTGKKTDAAIEARGAKTIAEWQELFAPAFRLVFAGIVQGGPRELTGAQLETALEKEGVTLSGAQFKFFKSCFPDGYVKRSPGAKASASTVTKK